MAFLDSGSYLYRDSLCCQCPIVRNAVTLLLAGSIGSPLVYLVRCVVVLSSDDCLTPLLSFCAVREVSRMMVVCCN